MNNDAVDLLYFGLFGVLAIEPAVWWFRLRQRESRPKVIWPMILTSASVVCAFSIMANAAWLRIAYGPGSHPHTFWLPVTRHLLGGVLFAAVWAQWAWRYEDTRHYPKLVAIGVFGLALVAVVTIRGAINTW